MLTIQSTSLRPEMYLLLRLATICAIIAIVGMALAGKFRAPPEQPIVKQTAEPVPITVLPKSDMENSGKLIRTIPLYVPSHKVDKPNPYHPQYPPTPAAPQLRVESPSPFASQVSDPAPAPVSVPSVAAAKPADERISRVERYCNRPGKDRYSWIRIKGVKYFCKE